MSAFSLPVTRPIGRALIVGSPSGRSQPLAILQRMGFSCAEIDDPYAAMAAVCKSPLLYRTLILSLSGLFQEELHLIDSVKRRFPHIEIWLTHTDGRQAALAEAVRLGADGLLSEDGMHRVAIGSTAGVAAASPAAEPAEPKEPREPDRMIDDMPIGEPVLSADELRALLQEGEKSEER